MKTGRMGSVAVSQRGLAVLCFLVAMIEGFDIQAAGVVAPRLAPALGLGPADMGLFFSAATLGLIAGAVIGGAPCRSIGAQGGIDPVAYPVRCFFSGDCVCDGLFPACSPHVS